MAIIKLLRKINMNGFTLVIPSVSVGNVPQLTVDLLISNFNFQKTGVLWHPAIIPSVGADPFEENSSDVCTACELYVNETIKLAVLQIRSGLEFKLVTKFFQDLKNDIVEHKIANVIILSSAFDYELHLIEKGKFFYLDNQGKEKTLDEMGIVPIEPIDGEYVIQGGGYSIKLYNSLKDICHCTILVKYVSEGDNRPDAISVMQILNKYIPTLKKNSTEAIKYPSSWAHLFGGPPPIGMY